MLEFAVQEISTEALTSDARYFEYSAAANPIRPSLTPRIPYSRFAAALYKDGPTRVVPLDLSEQLLCPGPATGPGLLASFVRIEAGNSLAMNPQATSQVLYVIAGGGWTRIGGTVISWKKGDFLALPGGVEALHEATADAGDAAFYHVSDEPLLTYLGVVPSVPRFTPTLYPGARVDRELAAAAASPSAANRSRISILLSNERFPRTRTVTHVLWAMYGLLPEGAVQQPHRHQSIALDFIVECSPGCYSLVGPELGPNGTIADPQRVDWEPGSAFVTPPGYWHAHFNESGRPARLIPVQDAGLHTYLRSLDIRFT